jgi:hypothetical protein
VNCSGDLEVAEISIPTAAITSPYSLSYFSTFGKRLPASHAYKNIRRPNKSLLAPAMRKPSALPVVYAGIYQYDVIPVSSPSTTASLACIAAVVGTGQKLRPKQEDKTKITTQTFPVAHQKRRRISTGGLTGHWCLRAYILPFSYPRLFFELYC